MASPPVPNLPPIIRPAPPLGEAPARARARLTSLVADDDYPPAALRANEQGTVGFTLDVGPNGRVTACAIVRTSGSAALDSATCRIMRARARFIPARDRAGMPVADHYSGSIVWRINRRLNQPFVPLQFVEEMRADAAGVLSCWSGSNGEPPEAKPCPPGASGPQLAGLARVQRMPLTLSTVMALTPAGAAELADRKARGDLYRASEALLTIAADGSILECRVTSSRFFGGGNVGVPPSPCLDWYPTMKLYLPAEEGAPPRTVKLTVRGYAAHAFRRARLRKARQ
jgi:TonB family protein